jgi:hypothetical protein
MGDGYIVTESRKDGGGGGGCGDRVKVVKESVSVASGDVRLDHRDGGGSDKRDEEVSATTRGDYSSMMLKGRSRHHLCSSPNLDIAG